jgi:hypothetical protein
MVLVEQLVAAAQLGGFGDSYLQALQDGLLLGVGLANGFVHGPELEKSRHHCPAKNPLNPTAQLLTQRGELALPYVTVLGPKDGAAGRLSVAQAFNSVAYIIAPLFMGWLADQYHCMAICFILPLIGFIAPTIYGFAYPSLLEKSARAAKPQPVASLVVG